ncbi:MAG: alpha/beta hydrolase [Alphaproteobacteria bacterium]
MICWHGLTRNSRDFDDLAKALSSNGKRVICPDTAGRGRSDWLPDASLYGYPQYLRDAATVIGWAGAKQVDWVGTSMGGLIGMMLSATPGAPIRSLTINDVGPLVPAPALNRIADYVATDYLFADLKALEDHLRDIHAPFGNLSDAQWAHLAEHSHRVVEGGVKLAYDPAIGDAFKDGFSEDVDLWAVWDMIRTPALVLRGAESDLLRQADAQAMTTRGPKARLVEFQGCGHAPALMDMDQINTISDFLNSPATS